MRWSRRFGISAIVALGALAMLLSGALGTGDQARAQEHDASLTIVEGSEIAATYEFVAIGAFVGGSIVPDVVESFPGEVSLLFRQNPKTGWSPPQVACVSDVRPGGLEVSYFPGTPGQPEAPINPWESFIFRVLAGEDIVCTFTNQPLRDLVIEKEFVGGSPATADLPTLAGLPAEAVLVEGSFAGSTYRWHYEVPLDWEGTITETPKPGWFPKDGKTTCEVEAPDVEQEESEQRIEAAVVEEPDCTFVNEYGRTVDLIKEYWTLLGIPTASAVPTFNLPAGSALIPSQAIAPANWLVWFQVWHAVVPHGWEGEITENVPAGWSGFRTSCTVGLETEYCVFRNGQIGKVRFEKWEDLNRNGVLDAADVPIPNAPFVAIGKNQDGSKFFQDRFADAFGVFETDPLSIAGGYIGFEEVLLPGWAFVASAVDGAWNGEMIRETTVPNGGVSVVQFLSRRAEVDITASKTIFNNANPSGGNGGAGWQFTLSGCGVGPLQGTTDASGTVTWSDLPAALDCEYTVTETPRAGWVADSLRRTVAPIEDGSNTTVTFVNRQIEGCTNVAQCGPAITASSPVPSPTVAAPTATEPAPEPTSTTVAPEETVAGEATPGPGANPTPIAPATGGGTSSTAAGLSLLAILGTIVLASGATILLAARRR